MITSFDFDVADYLGRTSSNLVAYDISTNKYLEPLDSIDINIDVIDGNTLFGFYHPFSSFRHSMNENVEVE